VTIYVVMGTTGEYSDRGEWPVRAHRTKLAAEDHVARAERLAKAAFAKYGSHMFSWQTEAEGGLSDEFKAEDPNLNWQYTGTSYFIYEVELADEPAVLGHRI